MGESRGEQAGSVLVAVVMFDTNVVERIFDISDGYWYFSECFRTRSPIRVVEMFVVVLVSRRLRFRAFFRYAAIPLWRRARGAMAERRVLALLGPCRVDGVGGGVGFEDLRGFDGVDLDALHVDFTSVALVAALGRLRDAVVAASHAAADAAWSPLGLSAPSARFSCCSWWPELPLPSVAIPAPAPTAKAKRRSGGVPSPVDRASPDQRWLDPARAEDAFALLSSAAERVAVDGPDVDAETTTPAKAAARAVALLDADPETARANANTDVAWIVAGVDGGGAGDGEWPPEAVAAHGVLLAARRAGARAVVVVLTPSDTSRQGEGDDDEGPSAWDEGEIDRADDHHHHHHHHHREGGLDAPRLILDVAARAGAEVIVLPAGAAPRPSSSAWTRPSSSPLSIFFDPGERWRGAMTIPSRDGGVRATLPGFRITSGEARRARDASDPVAASETPADFVVRSARERRRDAGRGGSTRGDSPRMSVRSLGATSRRRRRRRRRDHDRDAGRVDRGDARVLPGRHAGVRRSRAASRDGRREQNGATIGVGAAVAIVAIVRHDHERSTAAARPRRVAFDSRGR